jgi:hypothetical protein
MAVDPVDLETFKRKAADVKLEYWIIGKFIDVPRGKIILT